PTEGAEKTPGNKRKKGGDLSADVLQTDMGTDLDFCGGTAMRAAPKVPALPNGIRDILDVNKSSDLEQQEESCKRFKATVNSCKCGCDSTKRCRCGGSDLLSPIQGQGDGDACCTGTSDPKRVSPSHRVLPKPRTSLPTPQHTLPKKSLPQLPPTKSCCTSKTPQAERVSIQYRDAPIVIKPLSLPPDSSSPGLLPSIATWTTPLPSLHTHSTTTMDSCGCGDGCACAGCAEHRGAVAAAAAVAAGHHSCPDRCGTCQDQSLANMHVTNLGGASVSDDSSIESLLARAIAKLPPPPPGKLSVFQSANGMDRVALVVLPRLGTASGSGGNSSCCTGSSAAPSEGSSSNVSERSSLFPPLSQLNLAKNTAGHRRQIRSPSPSDDGLTDADAEGEIDPENEFDESTPTNVANNDWALAQLDVDVDLELELAADAIDCMN
ncbi:hypothetical protein FRC07_005294, partial [Ceratobasidium sp. 392]